MSLSVKINNIITMKGTYEFNLSGSLLYRFTRPLNKLCSIRPAVSNNSNHHAPTKANMQLIKSV